MEPFRKPDLNQPRYRAEAKQVDGKDFYTALCKKVPKADTLGHAEIRDIIKQFNEELTTYIMENREGIELPESLGYMFIASCKLKNGMGIDYHKSKLYGVKVSYKNWDTDGSTGKIIYTNYSAKYRFKDSAIWGFKPARKFKRAVSKHYTENWKMYIEINRNEKVSAFIDRMVKNKDRYQELVKKSIETYNEFDLND